MYWKCSISLSAHYQHSTTSTHVQVKSYLYQRNKNLLRVSEAGEKGGGPGEPSDYSKN